MGIPRDRMTHGDGIESRASKQGRRYTVTYLWTPRTEEVARAIGPNGAVGKPHKVRETVPLDKDGRARLESARRFKAKRMRDKRRADFVPPHIAKKIAAKQVEREAKRREPLLYEAAVEEFLDDNDGARSYADGGKDAEWAF